MHIIQTKVKHSEECGLASLFLFAYVFSLGTSFAQSPALQNEKSNVTTYHNDILRTGWNANEKQLKPVGPSAVSSSSFGLLGSASLDDQVDAQPLVVSNQKILDEAGSELIRDVVYVATEANTIYAIDADTSAIINHKNFGTPVSQSKLPHSPDNPAGQCTNGADHVGINSTPVIDLTAGTMYFVAYSLEHNNPTYHIHAIDLRTLADRDFSPKEVVATHTLRNGQKYNFDPSVSRQRPGLVLSQGNIYVGFGSFCDFAWTHTRGWLLGWKAKSLEPLTSTLPTSETTQLNNKLVNDPPHDYYLSSIWMSGSGIAADSDGNLFFVTGNSERGNNVFSESNLEESVVKVPSDLSTVVDWFMSPNAFDLNKHDRDFGSGGVLLLPDQPGARKHLGIALGKDGDMYLFDRDKMGHFPGQFFGKNPAAAGICFCAESYFIGSDGIGRIVSSGGDKVIVWKLAISDDTVSLVKESETAQLVNNDKGFFTSISSSGTADGSAIIWAVTRPNDALKPNVTLYAFDAKNISTPLYKSVAGTWPNISKPANSNIVPTIVNGKVYVASFQALNIFGSRGHAVLESVSNQPDLFETNATVALDSFGNGAPLAENQPTAATNTHVISGWIESMNGSELVVKTKKSALIPTGILKVDATLANKGYYQKGDEVGDSIVATGTIDSNGVMQAASIVHGQILEELWAPDK